MRARSLTVSVSMGVNGETVTVVGVVPLTFIPETAVVLPSGFTKTIGLVKKITELPKPAGSEADRENVTCCTPLLRSTTVGNESPVSAGDAMSTSLRLKIAVPSVSPLCNLAQYSRCYQPQAPKSLVLLRKTDRVCVGLSVPGRRNDAARCFRFTRHPIPRQPLRASCAKLRSG
jgi:hypothetical protein